MSTDRLTISAGPGDHARPMLTGPADRAESWLTWLADAFASTPHRFSHVQTVWRRAVDLRRHRYPWLGPSRADRLELAALLHDVGRALDPDDTRPHSYVGAEFLDSLGLHDVAPLVAHHSGARAEAALRGMAHLDRWVAGAPDLLAVLTYLDRTTGPAGAVVTVDERRRDVIDRYGPTSIQARAFDATARDLQRARALLGVR